MNKTLKLALGAVLSAGFIVSAVAQDNFPDVPDNHWAYEALARLKKDGLLVGYPDGLFRGNRPASRYELAVAIHATYTHLKNITDGLQSQIDELKGRPTTNVDDLRAALTQLQNDVNNMKGWGDDIANLKRLADQFQKELASLGVDVEGLKKDLADLAKRVGVLEAHRLPIDIHGDVNMFVMAGSSSSHRPGVTVDGRPVGVDGALPTVNTGTGQITGVQYPVVGMVKDFHVFHEIGIRMTSNNETGPKWHATLVDTNMLARGGYNDFTSFSNGVVSGLYGFANHPFSSMSTTDVGGPFQEGNDAFYFQDMAVDFDTSILGEGFAAELGRTSYSIDPYIFQRPDVTPYYQSERWDNGKWIFDGGTAGFHFGGAHLDVFAGRDTVSDTNGTQINPMFAGAVEHRLIPGVTARPIGLPAGAYPVPTGGLVNVGSIQVDEHLGLNLNVPLSTNGKLDLAYIWLQSNGGISANGTAHSPIDFTNARVADNVQVFGGDLKWNFGSIVFDGGYSQSNVYNGNHGVVTKNNSAWHAQAAYDTSKWGAQVGYRQIKPLFGAPGDWGRIGLWWNPTDIEGVAANAHFNLAQNVKLSASGEWYNGTQTNFNRSAAFGGGYDTGLNHNDRIQRYTAELGFRLNDAWNATLGAEWVDWNLKDRTGANPFIGGKPRERWYNIGLGYNLSDMARLNFLYQWSDYDGKNVAGFNPFYGYAGTRATGSLLTTQLTVKF